MQDLTRQRLSCFFAPILALLFVIPACTDEQTRENNRLRDEIIEVHDEAMDKIGSMYELELKLGNSSIADSAQKKSIDNAISALQRANKMMFDWMHQYQTLAVDPELGKDNTYRHEQLLMISEVQRLTDESIKLSEKLLGNGR